MRKLRIKAFNDAGIAAFRKYLADLREDGNLDIPYEMLEDEALTTAVRGTAFIEEVSISTRMEAAKYLNSAIVGHLDPNEYENNNMWAWISLFFFDQLCPKNKNEKRKPGSTYRYIPTTDFMGGPHRHLLKIPFKIFLLHNEKGRILLCNEVTEPGNFNEEIANRQNVISNEAIIETIDQLYFDIQKYKPFKGAIDKNKINPKPGTLRRLMKILSQLELNYDLMAMHGEQILSLLPKEFDKWKLKTI